METDEDLSSAPQAGSVFAGYRVDRLLGVGGMGFVLEATNIEQGTKVAIKMLLPRLASEKTAVARFLREGRAAAKIQSEHVGRVLDAGNSDGTSFIVMEYLDGTDLSKVLETNGPFKPETAVDYCLQACEAVAEAHALGIVHRDLKPSNLFLVRRADGSPCIKVLDFGISKVTSIEGASMAMTRTHSMTGSPLNMSPEQLKSAKDVDSRSDIWSIGCTLYEFLVGHPPFRASTFPELGALVLSGNVPDVRSVVPEVSEEIAYAIKTCLRSSASERFPSLVELSQTIAPYGSDAARISEAAIKATLSSIPTPESSWTKLPRDSGGRISGLASSLEMAQTIPGSVHPDKSQPEGWGSATAGTTQAGRAAQRKATSRAILAVASGVVLVGVGVVGARALLRTPAAAPTASAITQVPTTETTSVLAPTTSAMPTAMTTQVAVVVSHSAGTPHMTLSPTHTASAPGQAKPDAAAAPSVTPPPAASSGKPSDFSNSRHE